MKHDSNHGWLRDLLASRKVSGCTIALIVLALIALPIIAAAREQSLPYVVAFAVAVAGLIFINDKRIKP